MKKRSVIKLENFLLVSTKTTGAAAFALLTFWFVIPIRSVRDAYGASKNLSRSFYDAFPDVYNSNVYRFAMIPFSVYEKAKSRAEQRLHDFDAKTK